MGWKQDKEQGTFFDADLNPDNGIFTYERAVDIAPVINANLEAQKDPQNGFFAETRLGRHIGEIPELVYYRDILPKFREFEKEFQGDVLRMKKGEHLRSFLTEHPQYRVVDAIVHHGVNDGNIVVK